MVNIVEACAECAQNCHLIHGKKKDPSSVATSFFKVMIGDNYSEVLFLPPKFARTIPALVDQNTQLEDSSGVQWTVTLSKVDGSLAFQEGWHAFSLDHGLKVGDLLVFYYIRRSHFVVQIYGRSGCQDFRQFEDNSNQKKRIRTKGNIKAKELLFHTNNNGHCSNTYLGSGSDNDISQHQPMATSTARDFDNDSGRSRVVSETPYSEEPFFLINRDTGYIQEDRSSLFDLSNFEIQRKRSDAVGKNEILVGGERYPHDGNTILKSPTEAGMFYKDPVNLSGHFLETCVEKPSEIEKKSVQMPKEAICKNAVERSTTHPRMLHKDPVNPSRHVSKTCVQKPAENEKRSLAMPKETLSQNAVKRSTTRPIETREVVKKEPTETSGMDSWDEKLHGNEVKNIESGRAFSLAGKDNDAIFKVVKTEPVDLFDIPSPDAANVSCLAVISCEAYLELPTCFPSIINRRASLDRKVVFLRGPDTRLWPVFYHEKYGLKVLKSGWEAFSKANRVRPGDECVFQLENAQQSIFRIRIDRK